MDRETGECKGVGWISVGDPEEAEWLVNEWNDEPYNEFEGKHLEISYAAANGWRMKNMGDKFKCRYGANCSRKDCTFQHPPGWDPRRAARGSESDGFAPSRIVCRYGQTCKHPNCFFAHPEGRTYDGTAVERKPISNNNGASEKQSKDENKEPSKQQADEEQANSSRKKKKKQISVSNEEAAEGSVQTNIDANTCTNAREKVKRSNGSKRKKVSNKVISHSDSPLPDERIERKLKTTKKKTLRKTSDDLDRGDDHVDTAEAIEVVAQSPVGKRRSTGVTDTPRKLRRTKKSKLATRQQSALDGGDVEDLLQLVAQNEAGKRKPKGRDAVSKKRQVRSGSSQRKQDKSTKSKQS